MVIKISATPSEGWSRAADLNQNTVTYLAEVRSYSGNINILSKLKLGYFCIIANFSKINTSLSNGQVELLLSKLTTSCSMYVFYVQLKFLFLYAKIKGPN